MDVLKGMPSDTFVSIPRLTKTDSPETESVLEGYKYEGMEEAIRTYINELAPSRNCLLLKRRTPENISNLSFLQQTCIDPTRRVGVVIGYDEEFQTFKVNISDTEYYSSIIKPVVLVSSIVDTDHENKIHHVKKVCGLYL